jgi:ABC-type nitrate/sulfonate/bicarbonate transport system substrate-binding protein
LAKGHLNLSDVHILTVPVISNVPIAVSQGLAQAAGIVPPFQKPLEAAGTIKLSALIPAGSLLNCFVVGPAGYAHPAAVAAFLRAVGRTIHTYLMPGFLHKTKVVNALANVEGLSTAQVLATDPVSFDPTLSLNGYGPKIIVQQKTWMSVGGLLNYSSPLAANKVMNKSFLTAAFGTA